MTRMQRGPSVSPVPPVTFVGCLLWLGLSLLSACAHDVPAREPSAERTAASPGAEAFALARARLAQGDSLRAEQYALLAIREGYPEARAMVLLVQACLGSSRLRAALVYAEPYLRKHPGHAALRYLVATVQLGLGHAELAERELQRVWTQAPELAEPQYLGGVIARDAFGDPLRARARFERYLALAPEGVHAPELRLWLSEQPAAAAADVAP